MMRIGTVTFLATTALLVPAGFRPLGAGALDEPAEARPPADIVSVGNANVEVTVDRHEVAAGESVKVRLVASAETSQNVDVTVALQEQTGSAEERMEPAPVTIEKESLRLVAQAGGGPAREMTFKLRGEKIPRGADPMDYAGRATRYTVLVESSLAAKAKSRNQLQAEADGEMPEGAVAIPIVASRPAAYALTLDVPPNLVAGQPFEVAIKVKNTSKKTLTGISLNLGMLQGESEAGLLDEYADEVDAEVAAVNGEDGIETLRPGQEKIVRYIVKPGADVRQSFMRASAWAEYGGPASAEATVHLGEVKGATAVATARDLNAPAAAR